jgi:C-terminal processing protease CtpA/Prc
MKKIISFIFITVVSGPCFSFCYGQQKNYNFDFEKGAINGGFPIGWGRLGSSSYQIKLDSLEKQNNQYSVLIEPRDELTDNTLFGGIGCVIPAIYKGMNIELKAFIKTIGVTQPIGLMFRIDGESKVLQFDNMMKKNITGNENWTEYKVTLPLENEAKNIVVGIFLSGSGKLWVDNITLLIDDKDFREAPTKIIKAYIADADTSQFKNGSGIDIPTITQQQIAHLDVLGKVWGMLKYYHPLIAKGNYNFDYELFRIVPKILNAKSKKERNAALFKWATGLGEYSVSENNTVIKNETIKVKANLKWAKDKSLLGSDLVAFLEQLQNISKDSTHYYVGLAPNVGNPVFYHENSYSTMTYPDAGYRLLSLYRYWNIIQYYYPYRYLIGEDWENVLTEFIPIVIKAQNAGEYQMALLKLITRINDTHANIYQKNIALDSLNGIYMAPFQISFIEGRAVIVDFHNKKLAKKTRLLKGDIITKIDNKAIDAIINDHKIITPASNEPTRLRNIASNLLRANDTLLFVEYERNGVCNKEYINCYLAKDLFSQPHEIKPSYKMLENNIGYIYMETMVHDSLEFVMNTFKNTKGIILDIRCYPSDFFTLYDLGKFLLPDSTNFVKYTIANTFSPGEFYFGASGAIGNKNSDYYKGKIAILVNEETQSRAEYFAMGLKTALQAKIIGSTTAGADGNISFIVLPGGIQTGISGIGIYYPDGGETQRIGIIPDIEVIQTIEEFRNGIDSVLKKAMEWINDK